MITKIRRPISILLALMLVVGMFTVLPISASAAADVAQIGTTKYETLEAAFAAAQDGDTITVLADSTGNGIKVPQGKFATGLTVDFADHTYTVNANTVGSTGTETQAFQLLKDNKITFQNGTIYSEVAKMLVQNYSDLTLDNMTLTLNNQSYADPAYTLSNNNGNVVIDDTTINANNANSFAFDVCRYASYPSVHVTVTGNSVINGDVEVYASKSDAKDGFSLTLESGEMYGTVVTDPSAAAAIAATPEKASVTTDETNFKFYVAQIGDDKYETLEAAFAAAVDGDTITVLANCSGNGIKVPQGKFNNAGLIVDFGGFTYTVDGTTVGSTGTETQAFQLLKDNKITFQNGTIYSEVAKMLVQNYSDLTLDNMTLTLNNQSYTDPAYTLSNNNGNVVIDDTTINANNANSFAFDVCRYSSYPSVNVTVTGNSAINGDVEVYASKGQAKDGFSLTLESGTMTGDIVVDPTAQSLIGEDNTITKADDFTQAAPADFRWVDNGDGTASLAPIPYVAQVGTTKYETLQGALDVVPDGGTVTVLQNITTSGNIFADGYVSGGNRTYTVDLGGNTVSGATFVVADGNTVTFTNGTIESATYAIQNTATAIIDTTAKVTSTATNASAVYGAEGSVITINGTVEGKAYGVISKGGTVNVAGTVTAANNGKAVTVREGAIANINDGAELSGQFGVVVYKDSTANIKDGAEITAVSHAVSGNGTAADGPYTVNVTGGTLTATNGAAIYNPNAQGTLNISGGTLTGTTAAVVSGENATTAISGGTFNTPVPEAYCAEGYDPKDNGDGTYTVAPHEHDWDYENVTWTFTENASHSIYAKYTLTCKTDPTHTKEQTGSGTLMSTVAVDGDKFVYSHAAVKIDGISVAVPNYTRNVADGIINRNELVAASKVAGEYTLANDITGFYDNVKPVDGFVLDGQNHMIKYGTMNASNRVMFVAADENTKFTLQNITLDGNNKAKWAVCAYTGNSGNNAGNVITLENVTIQNFKSNDYVGAINAFGSSTWNLKDCTITGNTTVDDSDGLSGSAVWAGSKATINIDGGTYDEVYLHSYSGTGAVLNADGGAAIDNLVLDLTKTDTLKANIDEATVGAITSNEGTIPEEAVVMDPAKATVAAPEGYKWVDSDETGMKTLAQIVYVAHNTTTDTMYETLEAAFAAAVDGDTIKVLADCSGNGIKVLKNTFKTKGLTVDFDGHTYTMDGATVGSPGTQTLAFQLQYGNKITFKGGTLYSEKALFLVQNYSNLTLDGMTLTLDNPNYAYGYTLSNNNGNTVIKDTTINANPAGKFAFDVCRGGGSNAYPSVNVTVTGNSVINGNVEVDARNGDPKNGFSLNLNSGTLNGEIKLTANAETAIDNNPDKASVNKKNTFTQAPAEGYEWHDNGDGTSTLVKVEDLFPAHSITLDGNVNLNFYINTKAIPGYANASSVKATFTWDSKVIESGKHYGDDVVVVELKNLDPDAKGWVKAYVPVNAAQMANDITAKVYVGDDEALAETDVYSVMEYAQVILADPATYTPAGKNKDDLVKLVKDMLNYGAMAQTVFGEQLKDDPGVLANSVLSADDRSAISEEMSDVNSTTIINAVEEANGERGATVNELRAVGEQIGGEWYTTSVIFLNGNTLRHYFDNTNEIDGFGTGYHGIQDNYFYYVEQKNIAASDLDKLYTFTIGGESFQYSVLDYAAAILDSASMGDAAHNLAKSLYLYNQAANAYFG